MLFLEEVKLTLNLYPKRLLLLFLSLVLAGSLVVSISAVDVSGREVSTMMYVKEVAASTTYLAELKSRSGYELVDNPLQYDENLTFPTYGYIGALWFSGIYNSDNLTQIPIRSGFSYKLTMVFNNKGVSSWNFLANDSKKPYVLVRESGASGISDAVNLTEWLTDDNWSITVQNSLGTYQTTVTLIFNTVDWLFEDDVMGEYIAPWLYCRAESRAALVYTSVTGTIDLDKEWFNTQLLGTLSDFASQNHTDLQEIKEEFHEGFWYEPIIDKQLNSSKVDDYEADLSGIYDSLDGYTVDLDGETISVDANTFNQLNIYLESHAYPYTLKVGQLINRTFTLFANYLAVPMTLSLMMGLIVWFLGRRVDV